MSVCRCVRVFVCLSLCQHVSETTRSIFSYRCGCTSSVLDPSQHLCTSDFMDNHVCTYWLETGDALSLKGVYSNWLNRGQHRTGAESDVYDWHDLTQSVTVFHSRPKTNFLPEHTTTSTPVIGYSIIGFEQNFSFSYRLPCFCLRNDDR